MFCVIERRETSWICCQPYGGCSQCPGLSRNWCWPAGRQGWGPGILRASASLLFGGVRSWGLWLQSPQGLNAGVCLLVSGVISWPSWLHDQWCPEAGVSPLVGKAQSCSGSLRDPKCSRAAVGLLEQEARVQPFCGLVFPVQYRKFSGENLCDCNYSPICWSPT